MLLTDVPSVQALREETHGGPASAEPQAPPSRPAKPSRRMSHSPILSRLSPLLPLCSRLSAKTLAGRAHKSTGKPPRGKGKLSRRQR